MFREIVVGELEAKGFRTRPGSKSGELWVCCPFCVLRGKGTPDIGFHLGLNTFDGRGHCFRCEWRSHRALNELGLIDYVPSVVVDEITTKKKAHVELPEGFTPLRPDRTDYWLWKAWKYVRHRRATPSQILKHKVGFSEVGQQRFRVVFPIFSPNGRLVGYTGRTILEKRTPSWLHMPDMEGMFLAQFGTRPVVTLVEGIFDALAVERGLGNETDVVAILGSHIRVANWLKRYAVVVLWLDPDAAGKKAMVELAESLAWTPEVCVVISKQEPADSSPEDLVKAWCNRKQWSWNEGLRILMGDPL